MKKIILLAAAMVLTLSAYATNVTKKLNVSSFNGLEISSYFDVTVVKGSKEKVEIIIDEDIEPYLIAKVYGGVLRLGLDTDRMPDRLRRNNGDRTLKAEITMSSLIKLGMSGATKLTSEDEFVGREFEGEFSGASKIHSLNLRVSDADFDISGATSADISIRDVNKADFDLSGASNLRLSANGKYLEVDVSGAASCKVSGNFDTVSADCSGASKTILKGRTENGSYDASGASKIDADGMVANEVEVDASGASSIECSAGKRIVVELSGASSLYYTAPESVTVDVREMSRGCSMKRR